MERDSALGRDGKVLLTGAATHRLRGLRAQPYASYLAALGLLGLVSEQADETAQAWWQGGHFHLRGGVDPERFLLCQYAPTPIASPWNGGSGFYPGESARPREAIAGSTEGRFESYRQTLAAIDGVLADLAMTDKPSSLEQKAALLGALHRRLPGAGRRWLDAVVTISEGGLAYSPLFFSGGNDAKFEMSRPFLANLHQLFLDPDRKPLDSAQALQALLHDQAAPVLKRQTHGALDPFTVSALNGTSDGDSTYLANAWCYILALEGLLVLAPYHSTLTASSTTAEGSGELLLPLWSEPRSLSQVRGLLSSGRAEAHQRFAVARRNGRAHFVIPVTPISRTPGWGGVLDWLQVHRRNAGALRRAIEEGGSRALEELGKLGLFDSELADISQDLLAGDQTAEYDLALALAGLGYGLSAPLHLRPHMSHFAGRDVCEKMICLARRRQRAGTEVGKYPNHAGIVLFNDPFWSRQPARPGQIQSFLRGRIQDARLGHLLHALCLAPVLNAEPSAVQDEEEVALLPLPYRLAKLAFHQHGQDRRPAPIAILDHLCAERWQAALEIAQRFLSVRHPDLAPAPSHAWTCDGRRVAAALLFPISKTSYQGLLRSVQR